jgi:hypothetical protein
MAWFISNGLRVRFMESTGDPPLGRENAPMRSVAIESGRAFSLSSGQWPDETGWQPVPPSRCEISGLTGDAPDGE